MEGAIVPTKQVNADMAPNKKKRSGPVHFFRIAIYALRFRSRKSKSAQVQAIKNVVGSIRPLHYSSAQIEAPPEPEAKSPTSEQEMFESYTPPLSPPVKGKASSWASSSNSSASRYASANDLLQLCRKESELQDEEFDYDEDEEDKYFDGLCGDDMIDSKADAFIAGFYEQMRLQREAYKS